MITAYDIRLQIIIALNYFITARWLHTGAGTGAGGGGGGGGGCPAIIFYTIISIKKKKVMLAAVCKNAVR